MAGLLAFVPFFYCGLGGKKKLRRRSLIRIDLALPVLGAKREKHGLQAADGLA
jgi:hypothetical protein